MSEYIWLGFSSVELVPSPPSAADDLIHWRPGLAQLNHTHHAYPAGTQEMEGPTNLSADPILHPSIRVSAAG